MLFSPVVIFQPKVGITEYLPMSVIMDRNPDGPYPLAAGVSEAARDLAIINQPSHLDLSPPSRLIGTVGPIDKHEPQFFSCPTRAEPKPVSLTDKCRIRFTPRGTPRTLRIFFFRSTTIANSRSIPPPFPAASCTPTSPLLLLFSLLFFFCGKARSSCCRFPDIL